MGGRFRSYPALTDAQFRRLFAVIREYLDALDAGQFATGRTSGAGCVISRSGAGIGLGSDLLLTNPTHRQKE
jgi:hypothetical protein